MSNDTWTHMLDAAGVESGAYVDRMKKWLDSGGGGLPADYRHEVNTDGELELWKGEEKVARQSPDGSWFVDSISTGVGSLHLGGNESGGMAHSISSIGQNVGFKNEFSEVSERDKLVFFPPWQAISVDGTVTIPPSVLVFGPRGTSVPNGNGHATAIVDYDFNFQPTHHFATFSVTCIAGEDYTGKLQNVIISVGTGAEIYNTVVDVVATSGQPVLIEYKYPFFVRTGDNLRMQLLKEDGQPLKALAGTTDATVPYRSVSVRSYTDQSIGIEEYLTGTQTDSGASVVDSDQFIHNDNGVMKQTAFSRLWEYIKTKGSSNTHAGAVSSIFGSKLTAARVLQSDGNGNVAASVTSSGALSYLNNVTSDIQAQLNGKQAYQTNLWRLYQAGLINSGGTVIEANFFSFSCTRTDVGKYTISGLGSATHSMPHVESLADNDNMHLIYAKTANSFKVAFYDAPSMVAQDTNFRIQWSIAY